MQVFHLLELEEAGQKFLEADVALAEQAFVDEVEDTLLAAYHALLVDRLRPLA